MVVVVVDMDMAKVVGHVEVVGDAVFVGVSDAFVSDEHCLLESAGMERLLVLYDVAQVVRGRQRSGTGVLPDHRVVAGGRGDVSSSRGGGSGGCLRPATSGGEVEEGVVLKEW